MTDPLSIGTIPTAGVDTSYPLAPEGDYRFQISENRIEPNFDKTVLTWSPKLVTVEPITALDQRIIPVNTNFFLQWPIELAERPEPKYPGAWLTTLINAVDAVFGTTKEDRPDVTLDYLNTAVGRHVIGHVIIDEDKNGVKRNKIKRLKKATE